MYIAGLSKIVSKYSAKLYGYADDHKLSWAFTAGDEQSQASIISELEACLNEVSTWMATNKLKMNDDKTEIIIYGTKKQLSKVNVQSLRVGGAQVSCVDHVRDLGVWMENTLNLDLHIRKICQRAHHQLRNLHNIRNNLSEQSTKILMHGLVLSHLDFCNGLYAEIPAYQLKRLQKLQHRAARIVTRASYDQPIKPILKSLHWLPVEARVKFKILVTVYKCLNGTAPVYLQNMLTVEQSPYSLRSSQGVMLKIPRVRTKLAEKSFSSVGPRWWNVLPVNLKTVTKETVFRQHLKTHLFLEYYNH